eukprot:761412-Pleurochrysis_carterae.AAC.2
MDPRNKRCHRQFHHTLPIMSCLFLGLPPKGDYKVSTVIFDSEGLNETEGVCGYMPRLRVRRSLGAPKRSTMI